MSRRLLPPRSMPSTISLTSSGPPGERNPSPQTISRRFTKCSGYWASLLMRQSSPAALERRRAADRKALEVVLYLGGFLPETAGRADAGHHLAGPMAGCVDVADGLPGDHTLLLARVEDLRAVAGPDDVLAEIGSVDHEEILEQLPIGEAVRIEGDLDRLGMTDVVLLGRILVLPAHPADARGHDPVAVAKQLLHDPEAAPREDRALGVFAH